MATISSNIPTPRHIRRKLRRRRTRIINGIIAIITAVLMLAYLLDYSSTGVPPGITQQQADRVPRVKYFLTSTHSTEFDNSGLLQYTLSTEEVRHDPADDSARIREPRFALFNDGVKDWLTTAQLGTISADGETIDLLQRVEIISADGATVLKTPHLTLYPNKKLAKTDKPVTLQNPYGFTRSIGLIADMQTERIDLLQQVRGQYQGFQLKNDQ